MKIARSTFYYRRKNSPGKDADVIDKIETICLEFPGYGYRRVTKQLQHEDGHQSQEGATVDAGE